MALLSLFLQSLSSLLLITLFTLTWEYIKSPLKSIPGPFFAKFTNLWRFFDTYAGRPELTQRILHERYGPAVRLGPNVVSLNDPSLVRTIYNTKADFVKVRSPCCCCGWLNLTAHRLSSTTSTLPKWETRSFRTSSAPRAMNITHSSCALLGSSTRCPACYRSRTL